jgi:hypothetical protein
MNFQTGALDKIGFVKIELPATNETIIKHIAQTAYQKLQGFDAQVYILDPGDHVICDHCNEDYSTSNMEGGVIFQSKAYCPQCAPALLEDVRRFGEERFVRAVCPDGTTFKQFVLDNRG